MITSTKSIVINVPKDIVYDYIMDYPNTATKWSINFIKTIDSVKSNLYLINKGTPMEMNCYYEGDKKTGVINIFLGKSNNFSITPTRVVDLGEKSLYLFTLIRSPDMNNEVWEEGLKGLIEELEVLKTILENKSSK